MKIITQYFKHKQTFIIFTFLTFSYCAVAQTKFITGIKGDFLSPSGITLLNRNDGSFLSGGVIYDQARKKYHNYIVQINSVGKVLLTKAVFSNKDTLSQGGIYTMCNTSDGGFAAIGDLNNKISLLKFNSKFDLQWSKQYGLAHSPLGAYGGSILQLKDNGFIAGGATSPDSSTRTANLFRTDSSGKILWSRRFFNNSNSSVSDVQKTNDGNIIVLASTEKLSVNSFTDTIFIIKMNINGKIIWSKFISIPNDNFYARIINTSDGGFFIGGYKGAFTTKAQLFMVKLDASGNLQWMRKSLLNPDIAIYPGGITEAQGGGFIVSGFPVSFSGPLSVNFCVMKIKPEGTLEWSKGYSNFSGFNGVIKTIDGGYLGVGGYNQFTKFDINFNYCYTTSLFGSLQLASNNFGEVPINLFNQPLVVDSLKLTIKSIGSPDYVCKNAVLNNAISKNEKLSDEVRLTIKTFPNPATNEINLLIQGANGNSKVIIKDINGKIVFSNNYISSSMIKISIRNFTNGVYVVQVINKQNVNSAKFLKD